MVCRCGCGFFVPNDTLIKRLTAARIIAGVPFIINRGCSCKTHNKKEGGSDTSGHLKGEAVDIKVIDSRSRFKIVQALLNAGFTRIGIGKDFIHADITETKSTQVVWVY